MRRETANLSILSAEIFDGYRLHQQLGEKRAQYLIRSFLGDLSSIAVSSNGESIRFLNDKLMSTFFSADDAVIAAATMHQFAFARPSIKLDDYQSIGLQIRIGTGIVVRKGKYFQGEPVDFAANMKPMAQPFQTLISESTRNYLSKDCADQTRFLGQWPINGEHHLVNIYEYIADAEATIVDRRQPPETKTPPVLDLILGSTILTVDDHYPVCTIGRQVKNDMILEYPRVSRWHAKVEKRNHKFILKDTSYNGTFIKIGNLDTVCLNHDEIQLIGKGVIFPGREATPSSPGAIHYNLR
jgi:class 3 adenylate cyclase